MCRIVTCSLRIAWANHETNVRLGIAAQIFVAVGTILLFVINLVFSQRIIRAQHPNWGWHRAFNIFFLAAIVCTILTLMMMIAVSIQAFYTLDSNTHRIDRDVQLYGSTFFAFIAFLPIPLVFLGIILPKRVRVEKFGIGRFRHKIIFLLTASAVLTLGAGWRSGTLWLHPKPRSEEPWYLNKACFYIFDFTTEVIVVALYAIVRVDRRFHVPNGAKGPGDYGKKTRPVRDGNLLPAHPGDFEKSGYNGGSYADFDFDTPYASALRVYSEEELFDDTATLAETLKYSSTSLELDNVSGRWLLKRQSHASLYSDHFRDSSSRDTLKTADSNVYSTLDDPSSTRDGSEAYIADKVKWETISMAHTRSRSLTSKDGANYASLLTVDDKPNHYSRDVGLEKPAQVQRDSWLSLANEKMRAPDYHSLASPTKTQPPPRTPRSEKRLMGEKSGIEAYAYDSPLTNTANEKDPYLYEKSDYKDEKSEYRDEKRDYRYDTPESGDLGEKRHLKRDSLEVPSTRSQRRKSSWRKSVESELRLSIDETGEEDDENDVYGKLTGGEKDEKS